MLLSLAFVEAKLMDLSATSMPMEFLKRGERGDGEETAARIGIDEVCDLGCICWLVLGEDVVADVLCEGGEDRVIVLEERTSRVVEAEVIHIFGGHGVLVGNAGLAVDVITPILVNVVFGLT